MTPVRLEPRALRSRVKHSTTEPLRSHIQCSLHILLLQDVLVHIHACLVRIHESTHTVSDPGLTEFNIINTSIWVRWVRTSPPPPPPSKNHKTIGSLTPGKSQPAFYCQAIIGPPAKHGNFLTMKKQISDTRYIDANEPIREKLLFLSPIRSRKGAYPPKQDMGERRHFKYWPILYYLRCK